ncbi:uncharacterized protein [Chanodichthys erythropterus]|uniref:uncharacterized protein n=1 Tax=Chanodichthys erythropterus TaxID=933992 RepID=UPI00351F3263
MPRPPELEQYCRLHPCAFSRKLNPAERNYDIGIFNEEPEPILPENLFVSPITWTPETLPPSNASTNTPPGCPEGLQYITRARRTPLIHYAHSSLGTGHPGVNETLSLLKERFWWPNMANDVRRYVQGCRECAMAKSPCHLPAGKLLPLPVPNRPWSHLGVDFVTDLPASDGYTCIFVVIDSPAVSSLYEVCQRPWKQRRSCLMPSSDTLVSQKTSYPTEVHSSSQESGKPSSPS